MGKLKNLKEIIKKIKSGVLKIQELNPKQQLQILMQGIISKLKIFLYQLAGWVVLGCLIIGVILLCFAALFELFKAILGFFQNINNNLQYIFTGTEAFVDARKNRRSTKLFK